MAKKKALQEDSLGFLCGAFSLDITSLKEESLLPYPQRHSPSSP